MIIELKNISKRYGSSWVLRDINFKFTSGTSYAITGPNGSGKSTLMKIISGGLVPSGGNVVFSGDDGQEIHWSDCATEVAFSAPYIELIERLTLDEHIDFHFKFREFTEDMDRASFLSAVDMEAHRNKQVRDFSSGMKQRLKLAFSFFTKSAVLLLDEPTSNLDEQWIAWYMDHMKNHAGDQMVIVASNDEREYAFCTESLDVG